MSKRIPLTNGGFTTISDEDYEWAIKIKWRKYFKHNKWYVTAVNSALVGMHWMIIQPTGDNEVDHKNGDGLDNRRENLREITHPQNCQNRIGANKNNHTKIRNVHYIEKRNKYRVSITLNGVKHFFGEFSSIEEAEKVAIAGRRFLFTHSDGR